MEKNRITAKNIVYIAVMAALCFLGTYLIQIPVPFTNGYIHLGDSMVFLSAVILGKKKGAVAAGFGSMLADLIGGWYIWIIPTLIIKALMAYVLGYILEKGIDKKTIASITSIYVVIWAGFTLILSRIISTQITAINAPSLLTEFEEITTTTSLLEKANTLQLQLLLFAILLPLIVLVLLFVASKLSKIKLTFVTLIGFVFGGAIMMIGYYLSAWIIYGNYLIPVFSIPANMIQFVMGALIATLLLPVALRIKKTA